MDAIEEALALVIKLPPNAIEAVFQRYGKPFDGKLPKLVSPRRATDRSVQLTLGDGRVVIVHAVRIRVPVDVLENDWFVLDAPGAEPLAIAGPMFAAALAALARATEKAPPQS